MKIKYNNIFKSIHKDKFVQKRRKKQNLSKEENKEVEIPNENIYFRRRSAIENNKGPSLLKVLKEKFVIKRSYYTLLISMVILAVVSVYTNIATYKRLNEESYEVFSSNDETEEISSSVSEELQDSTSNNVDTRKTSETKINNTSKATIVKEQTTTKPKVTPLVFAKPINGELIKTYSMDKLLYSKTLESWKTHDGVDISGSVGTNVKSIEKGIVEKIYDDSFLGTTVIIDHGQGYKSIYSNLDKNVIVKEKETIIKSKVIGKVGQTAIGEIKDDPHIHFMLMFNNQVIDPTSKIKF